MMDIREYVGEKYHFRRSLIMKIAAVTCANGLGHIRRVVGISSFMFKNGFSGSLTAFLPIEHLDYFTDWSECQYFRNHPNIEVIDFHYPESGEKKSDSLIDKKWFNISLPALDDFDIVWSDNVTQVLASRPDSILTGSFLWYDIFAKHEKNDLVKDFIQDQRELTRSVKPVMIGCDYFATPEVRNFTRFQPVGLYRYEISMREKKKKDILLSCGLGGEEEDQVEEAINHIIKEEIVPPETLWIEPRFFPSNGPKWIKRANFSHKMFSKCVAVCVRPGIGTLSDALCNRTRIFAFHSNAIFEMLHNSQILDKMGLGEYCDNPHDAYIRAIKFAHNNHYIDKQVYFTSHLRMDGIFATAQLISGSISV